MTTRHQLWVAIGCLLTLIASASASIPNNRELIFKVRNAAAISPKDLFEDLKTARIVVVGEQHDNRDHHEAQLAVIRGLVESGARVAVGMEMFRSDAQAELDAWTAGELDTEEFIRTYAENWDLRYWPLYRDIFVYARDQGLPLVGLNVPREVVRQVARHGFLSLDAEQRRRLGGITCNVSDKYQNLLGRVLGFKEQNSGTFGRFCEAQVVWDTAMARRAVDYVQANPDTVMVILAGNFHAWKHGIPAQIEKMSDLPSRVILPSSDEGFFRYDIVLEDADYVWWHL